MKNPPGKRPFAKKSLGQNFLVDPNYIRKIIDAVDPGPADLIVEIGPGRGALTDYLVNSGAQVLAIELDGGLVLLLRDRFADRTLFTAIEQDATEADLAWLINENSKSEIRVIKLVANLPYYISTAILQRLASQREVISEMVLMFQREVVDRILAVPGNSERGYLTVMVEAAFHVEKLFDVPPTAFSPRPKIWSSVVRLVPKPRSEFDREQFAKLVSSAFAQKRKTLLNNLRTEYRNAAQAIEYADIDPTRRAETLTLQEWAGLYGSLVQS